MKRGATMETVATGHTDRAAWDLAAGYSESNNPRNPALALAQVLKASARGKHLPRPPSTEEADTPGTASSANSISGSASTSHQQHLRQEEEPPLTPQTASSSASAHTPAAGQPAASASSPFSSLQRKFSKRRSDKQNPSPPPASASAPFFSSLSRKLSRSQSQAEVPAFATHSRSRSQAQPSKLAEALSNQSLSSPPPTPPPDPEPEEDFVVVPQDGPEEPPTPISGTFGTLKRSLSRSSWKSYSRPPTPQQETSSAFGTLKRSLSRSSSRSRAPTPDFLRDDPGLPRRPPSPATLQRTLTNSISPLIALVGDSSRRIRRTTTRRADLRAQAAAANNNFDVTEPPTPSEPLSEVNTNKQPPTPEGELLPAVELSPQLKFFPELLTTDEPEDLEEALQRETTTTPAHSVKEKPLPEMPSQSIMSTEDKAKVKSAIPEGSGKILYATPARIYYAHPDPSRWTYIGQEGAVALVADKIKGGFWFRMIDLKGTRGVTWEHELYDDFTYYQDRPFFHSFPGDSCMVGFVFADERDANAFYKKFNGRAKYASKSSKSKDKENVPAKTVKKKGGKPGKIDKSMISAPTNFKHVAHMGWSEDTGFSSRGVDESWNNLVGGLERFGITEKQLKGNEEFIQQFVEKAKAEGLDAANKAYGVPGAGEGISKPIVPAHAPPPASPATSKV
ncbi:hypothetical protein FRC00_008428 [Tulasnella sp. 408]|nr:hypothetical protein FRC00_008428 [Tulasnella sp. 408]